MPEFSTTLCVPADHPCLAGHFPGRPLVPAVLLLQSAADALRPHFDGRAPSAVSAAKFLHPVQPDDELTLHLHAEAASGRARFRYTLQADGAERTVAHGELRYAVDGRAA